MTTGKATSQEAVWVSGTLQTACPGIECFQIPFRDSQHGGLGNKPNNPSPGNSLQDFQRSGLSEGHFGWLMTLYIYIFSSMVEHGFGDVTGFRNAPRHSQVSNRSNKVMLRRTLSSALLMCQALTRGSQRVFYRDVYEKVSNPTRLRHLFVYHSNYREIESAVTWRWKRIDWKRVPTGS